MKKTPMFALRNYLGLTQTEISREIGMARSLVSMAEYGQCLGGLTTLKIMDRYRSVLDRQNLNAEDFLRGKVRRKPA